MTKNVVLYTPMYDTGGQGWKIKRALERHFPAQFSVRSIVTHTANFDFPRDVPYKPEDAYRLFAEADIIHMRNGVEGLSRLLKDRTGPPPRLIVHHHGTRFRQYHELLAHQARRAGATQVASTIDLTLLEPDVAWLPAPFDLGELIRYRPVHRATGPIRIAHAPTNRSVKSTERFMAAVTALRNDGHDIVFDLIERQTWVETMRRKGLADIVVDQLELGIGNNALEAFGMSIPVIAGVADPKVKEAMIQKWCHLPFYEADTIDLEAKLEELIVNAGLRAYWGSNGFDYLITWHDEKKVARRLAELYEGAV